MWRLIGNAMVAAGLLLSLAFGLTLAGWWPETAPVVFITCADGPRAVLLQPPHPCPPPG